MSHKIIIALAAALALGFGTAAMVPEAKAHHVHVGIYPLFGFGIGYPYYGYGYPYYGYRHYYGHYSSGCSRHGYSVSGQNDDCAGYYGYRY